MKKLLKSRKALSPVVAAIILIAVTVAVSIAVAAWMGALTFTFMKTEELKIVGAQYQGTVGSRTLTLTVQNSGTTQSVIASMKVEDTIYTITDPAAGELTLPAGESGTVTCNFEWANGTAYNVAVVTKDGNQFTYRATAPTS